LVVGAGNKKIQ